MISIEMYVNMNAINFYIQEYTTLMKTTLILMVQKRL